MDAHPHLFFIFVGIIGFVRSYFGTGRLWLGMAVCVVRALIVWRLISLSRRIVNFREITSLRRFDFLGDTISMPWACSVRVTVLGSLSSLLMLAFVIDASFTLWRRGTAEG